MNSLISPTAARRIRIAVALVLLDNLPPDLSISEDLLQVRESPQPTRAHRGPSSEGDSSRKEQLDAKERDQKASEASLGGLRALGSFNHFGSSTDSVAVKLAERISPNALQIVSLLVQSSATSPSVISELLKLVGRSVKRFDELAQQAHPPSTPPPELEESILGAARLSWWIVERLGKSGLVDGAVDKELGDVLSGLIDAFSSSSTLPPSNLTSIIIHAVSTLPNTIMTSILPIIVDQTLASFTPLVQSLFIGANELGQVQPRLLSLVTVLALCIDRDGAGAVSQSAKAGLTRIIAEVGVSEFVGVEVEGAVLALLEDFKVL